MRQLRNLSKFLFLFLSFTIANSFTYSQVGIGTSTPVSSAQLEVYSNSKGFLPPRMTQQERNSISSPVAGLVLWCSNCGTYGELQVYNGVIWVTAIGGVTSNATAAVTTASASSISYTSATGGGTIGSDGGAAITAYGICWSTSPNPDVSLGTKIYNSGAYSGAFSESITGLSDGTTYYVRAFAVNSVGTSYGSQKSFTTTAYTAPSLTSTAVSSISYTTGTSGGNVSANGGSSITSYGICWSTITGPTIALSTKTMTNAAVSGAFSDNLTDLTAGTTYYVRAYATNSVGTSYGSEVSFTTTALAVPTLTTTAVSSIASSTATSGGSVSSNGGATITSYGICWSTSTSPTTSLSTKTTTNASISGAFSGSLTGLSPSTTYYVRAYATNGIGTSYGNEITFSTAALNLAVGDSYQGGKVGYFFVSGEPGYVAGEQHGIIFSSADVGSGIISARVAWNLEPSGVYSCAGVNAIGNGRANTNIILAVSRGSEATSVAKICDSYSITVDGVTYDDWFLPNICELDKFYLNRDLIGNYTPNGLYRASSEGSGTVNSWYIGFTTPITRAVMAKDYTSASVKARAARYF